MSTLGVVVLSLKGMKHLRECLESLNWADAILVLHAGDGAPAIGSQQPSSLVVRKAATAKELKRLAEEIKTDWVLRLWGEERVGEPLKEELSALRREKLSDTRPGYRLPIRSRLLSCWIKGCLWEPSPALRLYRAPSRVFFEPWDASFAANGEMPGLLRGWLDDYTLSDLSDGMDQIQAASALWAEYLLNEDRDLGPRAIAKRSFKTFTRLLFNNRSLSNGLAGLTLSVLAAYVVLLGGAKLWEARYLCGRR